jgi:hypothetical protein
MAVLMLTRRRPPNTERSSSPMRPISSKSFRSVSVLLANATGPSMVALASPFERGYAAGTLSSDRPRPASCTAQWLQQRETRLDADVGYSLCVALSLGSQRNGQRRCS